MTQPCKICPRCSQAATLDASRCVRCGHPYRTQFSLSLNSPQALSPPPIPVAPIPMAPGGISKSHDFRLVGMICGVLFLGSVMLAYVLNHNRGIGHPGTTSVLLEVSLSYDPDHQTMLGAAIKNTSPSEVDHLLMTVDFKTDENRQDHALNESGFKHRRTFFIERTIPLGAQEYAHDGGMGQRTVFRIESRIPAGETVEEPIQEYYYTGSHDAPSGIEYVNWDDLSEIRLYRLRTAASQPLPTHVVDTGTNISQGFNPIADPWPTNIVVEEVPLRIVKITSPSRRFHSENESVPHS
jgi:hypothetical protein